MPNPRVSAALLALLLPGCQKDESEDSGTTEVEAVDYATSLQAVFNRSCISCHNAAGTYKLALSVDLSLEDGDSYNALVGVPSVQLPSMKLVEPGDADASYLWHKLSDTHVAAGGSGDEMPPGLTLASNDLDPIRLWIEQGAQP